MKSLAFKNYTLGIIVDSRLIDETKKFHFKRTIKYKLYKNNTEEEIDLVSVDRLYSEEILVC